MSIHITRFPCPICGGITADDSSPDNYYDTSYYCLDGSGCFHEEYYYGTYRYTFADSDKEIIYSQTSSHLSAQVREEYTRIKTNRIAINDQFNPCWLTSTVIDLTESIRESKNWELLPYLADALMDAGCDWEAALNHLREPHTELTRSGLPTQQCWVIEFIYKQFQKAAPV